MGCTNGNEVKSSINAFHKELSERVSTKLTLQLEGIQKAQAKLQARMQNLQVTSTDMELLSFDWQQVCEQVAMRRKGE